MSMLSPKRSKFRKSHKGNLKGRAKGGDQVSFGDFGLQVTSPGFSPGCGFAPVHALVRVPTSATIPLMCPLTSPASVRSWFQMC